MNPRLLLLLLVACGGRAPHTPVANTTSPPPSPRPVPITEVTTVDVAASGGAVTPQWGIYFDDDVGRAGDEIDLVDCAGWLGRARLVSNDAEPIGWRVEMVATASALAAPCRTGTSWPAFAVLPADPARADVRASGGDAAATYASMPADVRAWVGPEGALDQWAHLDGDGVIDLAMVMGLCKPDDDYTCGKILVREDATWREVGYLTPL